MPATRPTHRRGLACVEFAICAPVLMLVGFGFINAGLNIQLRYNSKLIGHLAATELFKSADQGEAAVGTIRSKYVSMSETLGIQGLSIDVEQSEGSIAVVRTTVSVSDNTSIPTAFLTNSDLSTETYVVADLSSD